MEAEHVKESVEQFVELLRENPNEGRGPDTVATATAEEGTEPRSRAQTTGPERPIKPGTSAAVERLRPRGGTGGPPPRAVTPPE